MVQTFLSLLVFLSFDHFTFISFFLIKKVDRIRGYKSVCCFIVISVAGHCV